jgi:hypothetical protein
MMRNYLQSEWEAKKESQHHATSIPALWATMQGEGAIRDFGNKIILNASLSLPQQGNHEDSGLFLLAFLQYFLFRYAPLPPCFPLLQILIASALRRSRTATPVMAVPFTALFASFLPCSPILIWASQRRSLIEG